MLYLFAGPSCTGKSAAAEKMKDFIDVKIYTGRDYLRLSNNENEALKLFNDDLNEAVEKENYNIIYVSTDINIVKSLKALSSGVKVRFTADIDVIKRRFSDRMNGHLPVAVSNMLDTQYQAWESFECDLIADSGKKHTVEIVEEIINSAFLPERRK